MEVTFLKNRMEFLDEVATLWYEEWSHLSDTSDIEIWKQKLLEMCNESTVPTVVVALIGNELIGTAALVKNDMKEKPELSPWLASLFVKSAFRNRGIAKELIGRVELIAKNQNIKEIYLFTEHKHNYYKKLGWTTREKVTYHNCDVTIMQKTL